MSSSESEWRHCAAAAAVTTAAVAAGAEEVAVAAEETAVAAASVTLLRYALPWVSVSASPDWKLKTSALQCSENTYIFYIAPAYFGKQNFTCFPFHPELY